MSEHFRARQIVDGNDLIAGSIEHLTERETTNTTKSVDSNLYCHKNTPCIVPQNSAQAAVLTYLPALLSTPFVLKYIINHSQ